MRMVNGFYWVEGDVDCAAVLFEQVKSIASDVLPHVSDFSVCVQAGGNCGLFPVTLAQSFQRVITREPDRANYQALSANTFGNSKIDIARTALGDRYGLVGMNTEAGNCGASRVIDKVPAAVADVPLERIDDFGLEQCGLIYLDIEGYEEFALRGAEQTIRLCRPVIVVELKGLAQQYGRSDQDCASYLHGLGYWQAHKFDNDVVWKPAPSRATS